MGCKQELLEAPRTLLCFRFLVFAYHFFPVMSLCMFPQFTTYYKISCLWLWLRVPASGPLILLFSRVLPNWWSLAIQHVLFSYSYKRFAILSFVWSSEEKGCNLIELTMNCIWLNWISLLVSSKEMEKKKGIPFWLCLWISTTVLVPTAFICKLMSLFLVNNEDTLFVSFRWLFLFQDYY